MKLVFPILSRRYGLVSASFDQKNRALQLLVFTTFLTPPYFSVQT